MINSLTKEQENIAENIYTSTGFKYIRNFHVFESLRHGIGKPQSLQISLTNRCNLNCSFCSVKERDRHLEWNIDRLKDAIFAFKGIGIKTVELTGGGEPTLYYEFAKLVDFISALSLKIGLITNGTLLSSVPRRTLEKFTWIRVSMTTLDYKDTFSMPILDGPTLGFSYIVGQRDRGWKYELDQLRKIEEYADKYYAAYVRVVPECFSNAEEMSHLHGFWDKELKNFDDRFFFQHKTQKQAKYCWLDAVKPWLHTDGYIYPCNSVSLNTEAQRNFTSDYQIVHWTQISNYYNNRGGASIPWIEKRCDRCTFAENNKIIQQLLDPVEHEEFL